MKKIIYAIKCALRGYFKIRDRKGNIIFMRTPGKIQRIKYDENGRLIQVKDQFGYEENREYDKSGNLVSIKDEDGNEMLEL